MARRRTESVSDASRVPRDSIDRLIADWRRVRPDLDFTPVGVVSRLGRIRAHLDRELERLFAAHGIGAASFSVLVTLARLQEPEGVSQRRLMEELGLTSGTVSVRMDRLVADGLVERRPDPADRRNSLITLTAAGRDLFERIVPAHLDNERRLLAALSPAEQEILADVLRKLLVEFEGSETPGAAPARLGLALAPAHVTLAMRRAVGLTDVAGLLVRAVEDDGPAAAAGIRVGDVLARAAGRAIGSATDLLAAVADAAATGRMRLTIVRGTEERTLAVRLAAPGPDRDAAAPSTRGRAASERHRV